MTEVRAVRKSVGLAIAVLLSVPCAGQTQLNWQLRNSPTPLADGIRVHPSDDNNWFVSSPSGLFITRDAGQTWTYAIGNQVSKESVVIDPTNVNRIYAATIRFTSGTPGGTLLRSNDRGITWTEIAYFRDPIQSVLISPRTGLIYAAPKNSTVVSGIYRSADGGSTWSFSSLPTSFIGMTILDMEEDLLNGALYASAEIVSRPQPYRPPLYRSVDSGATWQDIGSSIPYHTVKLQVDSVGKVYALTEGFGLYTSVNLGTTWQGLAVPFSGALKLDPRNNSSMWGGASASTGGGVYYSTNSGASFFNVGLASQQVTDLDVNGNATTVYAAVYGFGIYSAAAGSAAFRQITSPNEGQVISVGNVTLSWTPEPGAQGYTLRVFRADDSHTVFASQIAGATSTVANLPSGTFIFQVDSCLGAGFTVCSSYPRRNFTVLLPGFQTAPVIIFPAEGQTLTTSTHTLEWTSLGASSYQLSLFNRTHSSTDLSINVIGDTKTTFTLRSGAYTMEVRACGVTCGPPAHVNFVVTLPPVPTAATAVTSTSITNQDNQNRLFVSWNPIPGADLYAVRVVQPAPAGPGRGALTVASRAVSATNASLLIPNGQAFIFVQGCNGDGCGPNSVGFSILPGFGNPALPIIGEPVGGLTASGPSITFTWNRIPGDNGTNTTYRLYVQDFGRQSAALDVVTTNNYWAAQFSPGRRYDAVVVANPNTPFAVEGPAQGFTTRGPSPFAPTMVHPQHQGTVREGNIRLAWTPLAESQFFQYYVGRQGSLIPVSTGLTTGTEVQVPLSTVNGQLTPHIGIVRACLNGFFCSIASDNGWGPWSNTPGGTGVTAFNVAP